MSETHHKSRLGNTTTWTVIGVVLLLLAILITFISWLYTGKASTAKDKIFSRLPLPVAMVHTNSISSRELYERLVVAQKVLASDGNSEPNLRRDILTALIKNKKVELLARQRNLKVSDSELEQVYQSMHSQYPSASGEEFSDTLEKVYGLSESSLKENILKPTLLEAQLSRWYNTQESLNKEAYDKARSLLNQLDTGAPFEQVANKYNEDMGSKPFAGDQGFQSAKDMLPEFQNALTEMASGEKKLVASRYGLHIIILSAIEGEGANRKYNIQQIFLPTKGFDEWLDQQSEQIKSVQLL